MKENLKRITYTALFVAVIAVISQIAIPMPSLVPITLQTFAICLCGYFLGLKSGGCAILVYVLLGAMGAPVFSSFQGGFSVILGHVGGFIIGFIPLALMCGISKKRPLAIILGCLGILICHLTGIIWYMVITKNPFIPSFVLVSLPYILKDIILCVLAYFVSEKLKTRIKK
jgi:biotin transport system substrate-specific component